MKERIKYLRKSVLKLSMESFGDKIGLSKAAISQVESGKNNLSDVAIKSICREFRVNEDWLRNGSGDMFLKDPEDELDALAEKYKLIPGAKAFIREFIGLPLKDQEIILNYIDSVAASLHDTQYGDPVAKPIPEMTEDEIHHRAKEIEQEMLMEKRAAASSSPSKRTAG